MSDLLPCPFCAGKNLFVTTNQSGGFCLTCKSCDAVGPPAEYEPEQMREAWNTRAAIAALESMDKPRVKPLVWEDHPADDGAVISKAVALHGTYFIVDDTDDFTGLYLHLISHDNAKWWQHVRSTCQTLAEKIHDEDLGPIKAAAQADYEARILAAIEPALSVREAARVLYDMPETDRMKAWRATRDAPPEFAKWFCVALRAIAERKE